MVTLAPPPVTEQVYQSYLPGKFIGYPVERYFSTRFTYLSEAEWIERIQEGSITVNGKTVSPGTVLKEHDLIVTRMGKREEPPVDPTLSVIYEDQHLRVFNKGAPLPIHPCGRYFKNSMTELLKEAWPGEVPRPVQRLDALTTGVQVFARTREAAADLMKAFQDNRVQKEYLALVEGIPTQRSFIIDAPVGKKKGSARGTGPDITEARPAVTEVEWIGSLGTRSILRVRPRTGRTNQIRVHLASVGLPLMNDPVYGCKTNPEHEYGLHAYRLRFYCLGVFIKITAPLPHHFKAFYETGDLQLTA